MKKFIEILRAAFPFLAVLLLWRLSIPMWNPAGMLALIPIFYYSFVRTTNWFTPFAALFCFLIDYKSDTVLFWTCIYCLFYAVNGFQNFIDLTRQRDDGWMIFMGYIGVPALILAIAGFSWTGLWRAIWLFCWLSILYIPFVALARRIDND